jgi:YVTN family beta-propeller protein
MNTLQSTPSRTTAAGRRSSGLPRLVSGTLAILAVSLLARGAIAAGHLSPLDLTASPDGAKLFISCATSDRVLEFDVAANRVARTLRVDDAPLGAAVSKDGKQLFVTCAAPQSSVCVVELATGKVARRIPAGHTAMAPLLSPDGKTLFVCNRFKDEVAFMDVATGKVAQQVRVPREPVAAILTPDGKTLFVANHLQAGRADLDVVAASISVIDTAAARVVKEIPLVNGGNQLRGLTISPDGKIVAATHLISRFHLPTTQIERGWINTAALTLIDVVSLKPINAVLLDNIDSGAANPWGVAWSADGKRIVVTHAGTHEISVIDAPALLAKLAKMPSALDANVKVDYTVASRVAADVPNDLSFLVGLRTRVKLPKGDLGPRGVALAGTRAFSANYFSDSLTAVDLGSEGGAVSSLAVGPRVTMNAVRKGEFYFNDGSICFQGWQSCASCHSSDARVDGLNWDNLNDGIGNPKNSKTLLLAHSTAPAMWLSVREDAPTAVRAGIKHSLFTVQPPEVADSLDAYLKSLQPVPSPWLVNGKLSKAAERGKKLFEDEVVGCAECHKGKYFTNLKSHDVGTRSQYDKEKDIFDTPSLIECWRGAPYLHDGSAATILDVLTTRNEKNEHGSVKRLTREQIADLAEYVLSL